MFYNLEGIPMKASEARSDTEWFGWVKSQITAHLFQTSICYYPWGGGGAWNNTQSIVSTRLWIKYNNCIVFNRYKIFEGFCLGTLYAILIYRDIGCKLLGKIYGISVVLGEIFCFFILKSLLELIIINLDVNECEGR